MKVKETEYCQIKEKANSIGINCIATYARIALLNWNPPLAGAGKKSVMDMSFSELLYKVAEKARKAELE